MNHLSQIGDVSAGTGRRAASSLLLALFLSVLALTQFESAHRALHLDSGNPDHHCAVTLLISGQLEAAGCAVRVLVPAVAAPETRVVAQSILLPSPDYCLPPSCGPPLLLA